MKALIKEHGILYEIGENQWTLPKHVRSSSVINAALSHYYKNPEEVEDPASLAEALDLPMCLVATKGLNAFEVYRRLADKAEEEQIEFFCPNIETAQIFCKETEISPYPLGLQSVGPKTAVFCFANQFTYRQTAAIMERWTSPETWPERILMFGDPDMVGTHGVGCPLADLLDSNRVPSFAFTWLAEESQSPYSADIRRFLNVLDATNQSKSLPWSAGLQMCDPENLKVLYNELLTSPNASDYHIICDSHQDLVKYEHKLRSRPPIGIRIKDKVLVENKEMDWVYWTWPISDNGSGPEEPRNLCLTNKPNHSIQLAGDRITSHQECCRLETPGRFKLANHPTKWATIQTFRDNRLPLREHIVLIITDFTNKKHLYTAACMSRQKLTIVGTLQQIEKALRRNPPVKKPASLLNYTFDPANRTY